MPDDPAAKDALAGSAARIEVDVRFLADDLLEGREAGTRGFDLAALYVATQYRRIGLEPVGEDGTFFQRVPMLRGVREREGARFIIARDEGNTEFAFESERAMWSRSGSNIRRCRRLQSVPWRRST